MTDLFNISQMLKRNGDFLLDISSLDIPSKNIVTLCGNNGSGKSTLLNILSLTDKPCSGELVFMGKKIDIKRNTPLETRRKISFLTQDTVLFSMNVFENISLGLKLRKMPAQKIEQSVNQIMEKLDLAALKGRYPSELSGGEARRVAIARTLAINSDVYLLDEPTSNIDSFSCDLIEKLIFDMVEKENSSFVISTHSTSQAKRLSSLVIKLNKGRING